MKKPIAQILICSIFLPPPVYAQEAIEIEIDSAPVEVEIHKPVPTEKPQEPSQQTAETQDADEEPTESKEKSTKKRNYGVAIAVGAIVAGALAALGGGGGGGGGTETPPQH
jgi:cell division septation protein DedD